MAGKTGNRTANEAGKFVFVALNHPHGIIFKLPDKREVVIDGNAAKLRGKEKGALPVGAYGLTKVAADDWEYIKNTYGGMRIFASGLIFARERKDMALDQAEEQARTRHGREPVDTDRTTTTEAKAEA